MLKKRKRINKIARSNRSDKLTSKPGWLYSLPSLRCKWWLIGLDSRRAGHSLQLCHGAQRYRSKWVPSSSHRDHTNWGGGLGLPHDCSQGAYQGVCAITDIDLTKLCQFLYELCVAAHLGVEGHWISTAEFKNYIIFCATNFQYFHYWTWAHFGNFHSIKLYPVEIYENI